MDPEGVISWEEWEYSSLEPPLETGRLSGAQTSKALQAIIKMMAPGGPPHSPHLLNQESENLNAEAQHETLPGAHWVAWGEAEIAMQFQPILVICVSHTLLVILGFSFLYVK